MGPKDARFCFHQKWYGSFCQIFVVFSRENEEEMKRFFTLLLFQFPSAKGFFQEEANLLVNSRFPESKIRERVFSCEPVCSGFPFFSPQE